MTEIAVVGLGYVGLPLAVAFGRKHPTWGFDLDSKRVAECKEGRDSTGEIPANALAASKRLRLTHDISDCSGAEFFIVAVPTPVDNANRPDLEPLVAACRAVGSVMRSGATVVFESTVYPGTTEEVCIPVLESESGLKWSESFNVAYSPERVNPGDKQHTLEKIVKLVAADDPAVLKSVSTLYGEIIDAGIHEVDSIRIAEAAKVIENTQRDLNIALVNELAIIFERLGLDSIKVLEAAGTKWNFLPFRPGLVGGHCIGVDPYYLTFKAQAVGYHPEVILAGRRINDGMGSFVARKTIKTMTQSGIELKHAKVNMLGITFKEDCPDLRNSQVPGIVDELNSYGCLDVYVHDPYADPSRAEREYGIRLCEWDDLPRADAVIVAVAHQHYRSMGKDRLLEKLRSKGVVIDVKAAFSDTEFKESDVIFWRL